MNDPDELELEHQADDEHGAATEPAAEEHAGEPQHADAAASSVAAPGIAYNERVFLVGMTQSGKSEILNHLFTNVRPQRVLIDSKWEYVIPGVEPVSSVEAIDWTKPVIHYRPQSNEPAEYNELFGELLNRPGARVVGVHELGDVCQFSAQKTPPNFMAYASKGQRMGKGLICATQVPVYVPMHAKTEAAHWFLTVPKLAADHHADIAKMIGRSPQELHAEYTWLESNRGRYSFLWYARNGNQLIPCAPLSERLRKRSIVDVVALPT